MCRTALIALAATSAGILSVSIALAAPSYEIVQLGLGGIEHTSNTGVHLDTANFINGAGQVIGRTRRFNGGNSILGQSAWFYDGAATIKVGLTGVEHTRNDGYKFSDVLRIRENGLVTGYSQRFNGAMDAGQSAWLYNGAEPIDIGLTGPEHTRNDGFSFSLPSLLSDAGRVLGYSNRYDRGSTDLGRSTWLYDGATTIDIGLIGNEHTRLDGYKYSEAVFGSLNEAGYVIGNSYRYNGGSTDLGQSAWIYDGTTTTEIGFTGPEHTRNDGYRFNTSVALNEAGLVIGSSYRYDAGDELGLSGWLYHGTTTIEIGLAGPEYALAGGSIASQPAQLNEAGTVVGLNYLPDNGRASWLYDGATTFEIGLLDPEHTRSDGSKFHSPISMNESGQVVGLSLRYNGGNFDLGESAWLYNGTTMVQIGLTNAEHTSEEGYRFSRARELNEAGFVIGYANSYGSASGDYAWLYNGSTTIELGFDDVEHTRLDGFRANFVDQLNEAGQVSGVSYRYNGGNTQLGQDAWFYDSTLDQAFLLQLSTRSDGYAYSLINYLGEDGLALGTYKLYDALGSFVGDRAFFFTVDHGLHDLGAFVDGGLTANGWDLLANALRANRHGQILGVGKLPTQTGGQTAYLLTPIVPEPSTILLAMLAVSGLIIRRRS